MDNYFYYYCVFAVVVQLSFDFTIGTRRLCKTSDCKHSSLARTISAIKKHKLVFPDNPVQYDDENLHFKHVRKTSKRNQHKSLFKSYGSSRHVPDLRARNRKMPVLSGRSTNWFPNITFPKPEIGNPLYNCTPFYCNRPDVVPELQCATNGQEYENTCLRECSGKETGTGVDLLVLGKCPDCTCKEIFEQECAAAGSAEPVCAQLCENKKDQYTIECNGGVGCACKNGGERECGSDFKLYENGCLRKCAGAFKIEIRYCDKCFCKYVFDVECGQELGRTFDDECIEHCEKYRMRFEDERVGTFMCNQGDLPKGSCYCTFRYEPECGYDRNEYNSSCLRKCADIEYLHDGHCAYTECDCIGSIWSQNCGATDFSPIEPMCVSECEKMQLKLAGDGQELVCNTKSSKKACLCSIATSDIQCGTDGVTYKSSCHRKCEDLTLSDVAYWGKCADNCDCRQVWDQECSGDGTPACKDSCKDAEKKNWIGCNAGKSCTCKKKGKKHCGSDKKIYPNQCALDCKGIAGTRHYREISEEDCEPL